MQSDNGATVFVIATREVHIGYGEQVQEISPGDLVLLPLDEATAWCLTGWAKPVQSEHSRWFRDALA